MKEIKRVPVFLKHSVFNKTSNCQVKFDSVE